MSEAAENPITPVVFLGATGTTLGSDVGTITPAAGRTLLGFEEFLTLGANQHASGNDAGTAPEARNEKFALPFAGTSLIAGTYAVARHGNFPVRFSNVQARCTSGSCKYQLQKNGVAYNGHGTALDVTTTVRNTTCTETLAVGDETTIIISDVIGSGLVYVTADGVRIGP